MKKLFFFIAFFYFLIMLQTSFVINFPVPEVFYNLILIAVVTYNLFESPQKKWGIFAAFIGGFYLDVFSLGTGGFLKFFGQYSLLLAILAVFIKFSIKKYVRFSFEKRF